MERGPRGAECDDGTIAPLGSAAEQDLAWGGGAQLWARMGLFLPVSYATGPGGAQSSACTILTLQRSAPVWTRPLGHALSLPRGWRPLPQAASAGPLPFLGTEGTSGQSHCLGQPPFSQGHCPPAPTSPGELVATASAPPHWALDPPPTSRAEPSWHLPPSLYLSLGVPSLFSLVKVQKDQGNIRSLGWLTGDRSE